MVITRGNPLEVRTASGAIVRMRALGEPSRGRDFPVVWVCTPEEYESATDEDREPDGLPWPLDAVVLPEPADQGV